MKSFEVSKENVSQMMAWLSALENREMVVEWLKSKRGEMCKALQSNDPLIVFDTEFVPFWHLYNRMVLKIDLSGPGDHIVRFKYHPEIIQPGLSAFANLISRYMSGE
jgi:hypothetical protein